MAHPMTCRCVWHAEPEHRGSRSEKARSHKQQHRNLNFFFVGLGSRGRDTLPGQLACGSTTDPTGGAGDDSDAAGMYDRMQVAVNRRDEGFDAERGRWRTQG